MRGISQNHGNPGKYDDIINFPRHQSATRPHMPMRDRAAQFSPFAALTGHEAAIREAARLTEERVELDEGVKEALGRKMELLREFAEESVGELPEVSITYFRPDEKKAGGSYEVVCGRVKAIDEVRRVLVMTDRREILMEDVAEMEGEVFGCMEGDA